MFIFSSSFYEEDFDQKFRLQTSTNSDQFHELYIIPFYGCHRLSAEYTQELLIS